MLLQFMNILVHMYFWLHFSEENTLLNMSKKIWIKKISILKVSIYYILNKNQLILELQKHLKMNSLKKFSKVWFFKAQYCSLTHLLILLVYFVKVASTYSRKC